MAADTQRFVPNRRDVAHEGFEREVILIHFPSGKYFRLDAAGKAAWAAIELGATACDLAAAFQRGFDVQERVAIASAEDFVASLVAHGLVVPGGASATERPLDEAPPENRATFTAPRLEVFSDLQDLFLVDPIHDVDDAGWPHAAP